MPRAPRSTLFPYTTLFRSHRGARRRDAHRHLLDGDRTGHVAEGVVGGRRSRTARQGEHTDEPEPLTKLVCGRLLEKKKRGQDVDKTNAEQSYDRENGVWIL